MDDKSFNRYFRAIFVVWLVFVQLLIAALGLGVVWLRRAVT